MKSPEDPQDESLIEEAIDEYLSDLGRGISPDPDSEPPAEWSSRRDQLESIRRDLDSVRHSLNVIRAEIAVLRRKLAAKSDGGCP